MILWTCNLACVSHPGSVRRKNEDALFTDIAIQRGEPMRVCEGRIENSESVLLAVADGLGGHNAGEVASRKAVEFLAKLPERTPEGLSACLLQTHNHLCELAANRPDWAGMGSTVAGLLATSKELWAFHLGDSRVYQSRDRFLELLTEDDSLAAVLVQAGQLDDDARRPTGTNVLTQYLGAAHLPSPPHLHLRRINLSGPRRFLLCTDGLSDMLALEEIEACVAENSRPGEACEALLAGVLQAGAKDNVTLIVADFQPAQRVPPSEPCQL